MLPQPTLLWKVRAPTTVNFAIPESYQPLNNTSELRHSAHQRGKTLGGSVEAVMPVDVARTAESDLESLINAPPEPQ